MAEASSSTPFFGIRDEIQNQIKQQAITTSSTAPTTAQAPKKKRNLPGTPYPDAEVIALSPKTLMATNRFICEVCNKGFQREQNLQLHRRGHNLPWKLKQKTTKEVKRRVYLCPEPTCVHHDPSRALGDLTGIKKHFFRKHGEKKWKCDKCSKRYAVQSDWKAHSKTCGTREYRCDCGTLFSRRDSFITHRAFCDALAQESARLPTGLNSIGSHNLYGSNNMNLSLSQIGSQITSFQDQNHPSRDLGSQFDHLISSHHPSSFGPPQPTHPSSFFLPGSTQEFHEEHQNKPFHGLIQLPFQQNNTNSSSTTLFNLINNSNSNIMGDQFNNGNIMGDHMNSNVSSLYNNSVQNETFLHQMSATALLQKAAQMGSTTSGNNSSLFSGFSSSSSSGVKSDRTNMSNANIRGGFGGSEGERIRSLQIENEPHLKDLMMNSFPNGNSTIFGGGSRGVTTFSGEHQQENSYNGFNPNSISLEQHEYNMNLSAINEAKLHQNLTRDFLGVGAISQREKQHGIDISSLELEMKSVKTNRAFGIGNLQ